MALTAREIEVLSLIERKIDTVAYVVSRLAERVFDEDEPVNDPALTDALADCRHDLQVVQTLNQP